MISKITKIGKYQRLCYGWPKSEIVRGKRRRRKDGEGFRDILEQVLRNSDGKSTDSTPGKR